jgi:hypothetical protein
MSFRHGLEAEVAVVRSRAPLALRRQGWAVRMLPSGFTVVCRLKGGRLRCSVRVVAAPPRTRPDGVWECLPLGRGWVLFEVHGPRPHDPGDAALSNLIEALTA